mgnify:CR=1 FL=1
MNILIGKVGKSVKFKNQEIATGGDTCMILYSTMSRMFPEHNFYFCGPNELKKLTEEEYNYLFPNHNVFSVYTTPGAIDGDPDLMSHEPTVETIRNNNIHIDFALLFTGYVSNHTLCKCLRRKDDTTKFCVAMNAFKRYAGPYVHVVNSLGVPLFTIAEDPRYITLNAAELFVRERLILTQMTDCDVQTKYAHIQSYDDHTYTKTLHHCTYADTEKIFLMGIDRNWRNKIDVQRKLNNTTNPKCIVLSNGHGTGALNSGNSIHNGRLKGYKEYIIDGLKNTPYNNTCVYGKWDDPVPAEYPQIQVKMICDLDDEIADAKYSFVYSIVKDFVTIKPYEMIVKGLIPFIHPDYDSKRLLQLPEYLYVKSPEDFANKMAELDADDNKYIKLLNECLDCIKPEYLDGSYVVNTIMRKICDNLGLEYNDHKGVESIMDHFGRNVFELPSK